MSPMRCFFPFKQQAPQSYQRRLLGNQERGKYPGEWTPALKEYVRKAFDPANSVPGWTRAAIQKELETMIYMNRGQDSSNRFRWRTMDLPQHIDPQYLPYERDPRDRSKDIAVRSPAPTSKMYPREFCAPFSDPKCFVCTHRWETFRFLARQSGTPGLYGRFLYQQWPSE